MKGMPKAIVAMLTVVMSASSLLAQVGSAKRIDPADPRVIAGIRATNGDAILEAGASGNPAYLPVLREEIRRWKNDDRGFGLRVAAARLGDAEELHTIWCGCLNDRTPSALFAQGVLPLVRGWFAVKAFQVLLTDPAQVPFQRWAGRQREVDIAYLSTRYYAMLGLKEMFPDGPGIVESFPPPNSEADAALAWNNWIAERRNQLETLEPTGANVVVSLEACGKNPGRR